jgi:hypothetical protein
VYAKTRLIISSVLTRVQKAISIGTLQLIAERALFISMHVDLANFAMRMAKFARSLVTCHCSLVSCHCSLVSCHCSLVSCRCSLVSCQATAVWYPATVSPRTTTRSTTRTTTTRTTTRTTTKQNLDPRCTYVQTRVKIINSAFCLTTVY